jgi:hypothetical protein
MPLSWNEIKSRAIGFAKEWAHASDERAQAQSFWIDFFAVFGLSPKRLASFERALSKHGGGQGLSICFRRCRPSARVDPGTAPDNRAHASV